LISPSAVLPSLPGRAAPVCATLSWLGCQRAVQVCFGPAFFFPRHQTSVTMPLLPTKRVSFYRIRLFSRPLLCDPGVSVSESEMTSRSPLLPGTRSCSPPRRWSNLPSVGMCRSPGFETFSGWSVLGTLSAKIRIPE